VEKVGENDGVFPEIYVVLDVRAITRDITVDEISGAVCGAL
jgi:hypothetical protein